MPVSELVPRKTTSQGGWGEGGGGGTTFKTEVRYVLSQKGNSPLCHFEF